ncbi:streptomycin 6-kinase [Paenibacillus phyllosphaerae]|uniref:Streptomycin 6-kinase n=1 Tax=Paenibacillus phyllosphaerae TaxID=274593 RepID=A0A7W5AZY7_9BACL|nr:aminoglycoside phosphotransferase family protein [Paenibacillus phyllosphaerae]MBB3111874.1 streptomycin 6-kinase [Paenibacillus phyllosphaerae]
MRDPYEFKPEETDKITARFGEPFYAKISSDLGTYADLWSLTSLQLIPSYSANIVFRCHSARHGRAVLKIGNPAWGGIAAEYLALSEYKGRRFCQVFEADIANQVMLEACVEPGIPLRDEPVLENRLTVFSTLYEGLHIAPDESERYPTYIGWVRRITAYMSTRTDFVELYRHMSKAEEICLSVAAAYGRQLLLHGDFHHDNILQGSDGNYVLIDPKGVIGDPVFDVPRFILNEFDDDLTPRTGDHINAVIGSLEAKLDIPQRIIRQCLYVETTMGMCWSVEDGAAPEELPKLLRTVEFAESLLA